MKPYPTRAVNVEYGPSTTQVQSGQVSIPLNQLDP